MFKLPALKDTRFKRVKLSKTNLIVFGLLFGAVAGYAIYSSFAASVPVFMLLKFLLAPMMVVVAPMPTPRHSSTLRPIGALIQLKSDRVLRYTCAVLFLQA